MWRLRRIWSDTKTLPNGRIGVSSNHGYSWRIGEMAQEICPLREAWETLNHLRTA